MSALGRGRNGMRRRMNSKTLQGVSVSDLFEDGSIVEEDNPLSMQSSGCPSGRQPVLAGDPRGNHDASADVALSSQCQ